MAARRHAGQRKANGVLFAQDDFAGAFGGVVERANEVVVAADARFAGTDWGHGVMCFRVFSAVCRKSIDAGEGCTLRPVPHLALAVD